jgi:Tol biopolymer transport system component
MKKLLFLLVLLSFNTGAAEVGRVTRGNLAIEGIPEIRPELMQRMRRYQFARSALFTGWTADGRISISTRFGNTSQIHIVDKPMGARRQVTFFDEPINGGDWSPTGSRKGMIYTRDTGGDENYQLEYLDPATTDPVRLTDGKGRADTGLWSPDGTKYAFQWTVRNGVASDVYIDDPLDKMAPELVFEAPEVGWNAVDWSPDEKSLLLEHSSRRTRATSGSTISRRTRSGRSSHRRSRRARGGNFSRDGKGVYIASDLGSEFRTLRYVDLATGKVTPLTDHIQWDIDEFVLSRDGRYLAYIANEDGASRLA